MLISGREACAVLAEAGVARTQGRRILLAGLAGPATAASSALLYDDARVRDLATWPRLTPAQVLTACPRGLFVARVPGRDLHDDGPAHHPAGVGSLLDAVRPAWPLSLPVRLILHFRAEQGSPVPLVATVSGFVAAGAEVVGATPEQRDARTSRLELAPPGSWFDEFRGSRFDTGPGKNWLLWPDQTWVLAGLDQRGTSAQ